MILYHGSDNSNIKEFTLKKSRKKIDFGVGIYLTSNERQAEAWAKRKKNGTVYVFDIDMKDISVFEYKGEDLDYVLYLCRIELEDVARDTIDNLESADIICGKMLKGDTNSFCELAEEFNKGDIPYEVYKKKFKLHEMKDQFCFKSQKAIDLLNRSLVQSYRVCMQ